MPSKKRARDDSDGDSDIDFKPDIDAKPEGHKVKKDEPGGGSKARKMWTNKEQLALYQQVHRLALENISTIRSCPELSSRDGAFMNHKLRGEFKRKENELGGDGRWIDNFKLGPSPKKKQSRDH